MICCGVKSTTETPTVVMVDWGEFFPKFIMGSDPGDHRVFVVHLHFPRFVGEHARQPDGTFSEMRPHWIDSPHDLSVITVAKLLNEARAFARNAWQDWVEPESNQDMLVA